MAHADMAEGIENFFVGENAGGHDQFVQRLRNDIGHQGLLLFSSP